MGNPGQRMLSSVTRAPGEGRTNAYNQFENRQGGQSRRVASFLSEGFQAPETATQTERRLIQARDDAANAEYGAVRNDAGQVDLVNTINHIDEIIGTQRGAMIQSSSRRMLQKKRDAEANDWRPCRKSQCEQRERAANPLCIGLCAGPKN
jgi:hypothetical protein